MAMPTTCPALRGLSARGWVHVGGVGGLLLGMVWNRYRGWPTGGDWAYHNRRLSLARCTQQNRRVGHPEEARGRVRGPTQEPHSTARYTYLFDGYDDALMDCVKPVTQLSA